MVKAVKKSPHTKATHHDSKSPTMSQIAEEDESKKTNEPDEELNSGFANYLRSNEGKRHR